MAKPNRFGQGYNMHQRPSRGEELDQRFGAMVVRMRQGVEAFQANRREESERVKTEMDAEIKALDNKVQRELAGYVRSLVLEDLVPVTTLYYAGPLGRSYLKLAKLALNAKQLGFKVDPYRFRDSIVAIAEGKENEQIVAALIGAGRFEKAREVKNGAFAAEIRQAAPKSWFEQKTGEAERHDAADPDPQDVAGAEANLAAATETGTRRSRRKKR